MYESIKNYVTNTDSNVFALKNLPEEVVAFLFARYSRSKLSLRDDLTSMLAAEEVGSLVSELVQPSEDLSITQDRARAFAEKYVLGYGHGSVAEHAVIHLAVEDVSIVVSKLIEDARLASYTEKSTRYVQFDTEKLVFPQGIMASEDPKAGILYRSAVTSLMNAYLDWTETFVEKIKSKTPRKPKQTEKGWDASCRATAFDSLRYLLPAATKTNIGITINARSLATLIVKLRSTKIAEAHEIADKLFAEGALIAPSLLKEKYTQASAYRLGLLPDPDGQACDQDYREFSEYTRSGVALSRWHPDERELDSILSWPHRTSGIVDKLLDGRGQHDAPPRQLERVSLTFSLCMDYGAYRDLQRHRIATQIVEPFTPLNGYEVPRGVFEYGFGDEYRSLMAHAAGVFNQLQANGNLDEAQYVLPLAYRVKVGLTVNLRQIFHLVELRSARQGHYSYRLIAQQIYNEVARVYPSVAKHIRVDMNDYALTRDEK